MIQTKEYIIGYCYGVVMYKASHATATIFWSIVLSSWFLSLPIHPPEFSTLVAVDIQ
jgi:hypothetical protein